MNDFFFFAVELIADIVASSDYKKKKKDNWRPLFYAVRVLVDSHSFLSIFLE